MTTRDTPEAALAEALVPVTREVLYPSDKGAAEWRLRTAERILAALPGWRLVPTVTTWTDGRAAMNADELASAREWIKSREGKPASGGMILAVRLLATLDASLPATGAPNDGTRVRHMTETLIASLIHQHVSDRHDRRALTDAIDALPDAYIGPEALTGLEWSGTRPDVEP